MMVAFQPSKLKASVGGGVQDQTHHGKTTFQGAQWWGDCENVMLQRWCGQGELTLNPLQLIPARYA